MRKKQSARNLRKEYCQCYTHNHQPSTARMLSAALEKVRDVPKKRLAEMGVSERLP
ncbi:MAG: hypothetical protein LUD40_12495 [Phocaeicola dorei]|nr:hypothetical protein [Phocaeicola dorei]